MKTAFLSILIVLTLSKCRSQSSESKSARLFKEASQTLTNNPMDRDSLMGALNMIDSAIRLDNNNTRYLFTKCKIAITLKKYNLALNSCNEILLKNNDNYAATLTKGVIFDLSNRHDSAILSYSRALHLLSKIKFEKPMYKEHEKVILFGLLNDSAKFDSTLSCFKNQFKNEKDFLNYYRDLKTFNRISYINSYTY